MSQKREYKRPMIGSAILCISTLVLSIIYYHQGTHWFAIYAASSFGSFILTLANRHYNEKQKKRERELVEMLEKMKEGWNKYD